MTGPTGHGAQTAGASGGSVRYPAVAGMFYPADAEQCGSWARQLIEAGKERTTRTVGTIGSELNGGSIGGLIGGIVPHAGWICSGALAGETIGAIARDSAARETNVELVVVFGAIHTPLPIEVAALDSFGRWSEPVGEFAVIADVRRAIHEAAMNLFVVDDRFHQREHAVEVELPLIRAAWPNAAILPVEVPLTPNASKIGQAVAKTLIELNRRAVFLASSDLTHYGPNYRFAPAGVGMQGLDWAKQNDKRLLDRVEQFDVDGIVPEVSQRLNACGGGAIAAMMSACREFGAKTATVLRHATSFETLKEVHPQKPDNAVGYASVVIGN
jgi:AmmeMemoRadiSam system protein B